MPMFPPPARNFSQLRPVGVDLGISCSASGSSYITVGDTKVKCCVNTPRSCGKRLLQEVGILSIDVRFSRKDLARSCNFDLRHVLTELFERHLLLSRYPRQLIEAWLTVEEDAGGLFAACVTGLCLAFADCGIQMLDVVAATSAFAFRVSGGAMTLALDLSADEEAYYSEVDPGMTRLHLAYCPNLGVTTYVLQTGCHTDPAVTQQLLSMAHAACDLVFAEIKTSMHGHLEWLSEQRGDTLTCPEVEM
ncbi:hypothetical protein BaOVIS_026370 [Babesia ovis]|uniref:Exoribonuclease phosphorolytic domain-containing protein n=1 Tax=Babesia ovis TaxID=5869 RepID=A0A9W5TE38_BABOV|nr:hypothetical protein BaOVIS_026370 [Babesia ovis]